MEVESGTKSGGKLLKKRPAMHSYNHYVRTSIPMRTGELEDRQEVWYGVSGNWNSGSLGTRGENVVVAARPPQTNVGERAGGVSSSDVGHSGWMTEGSQRKIRCRLLPFDDWSRGMTGPHEIPLEGCYTRTRDIQNILASERNQTDDESRGPTPMKSGADQKICPKRLLRSDDSFSGKCQSAEICVIPCVKCMQ